MKKETLVLPKQERKYAPAEWNRDLAANVPWQSAYATVEREAKAFLTASVLADATPLGTAALVEHLYPAAAVRGEEGVAARNRIFKALDALTGYGLRDYCSRGEPRLNHAKKTVRPWLWHGPRERPKCPTCGREL